MADERLTVIKVRDVLMVTMPPDPDDPTVSALQDMVLKSIEKFNPKGLILDISAVDTLDSFFARTIVETAKMVELMGGVTVIAGMRPSVAITATQLGFNFGRVHTVLDVDRGLSLLTEERRR
jgi:rsbT antagonist protein RsbS